MKEFTSEEIKSRLSNIGEAIGNIALEYIVKLEKENERLKQQIEETQPSLKPTKITKERFEELKAFAYWSMAVGYYDVYILDHDEESTMIFNVEADWAYTLDTHDFKKALYFAFQWYIDDVEG
jgi:hypothetical protein